VIAAGLLNVVVPHTVAVGLGETGVPVAVAVGVTVAVAVAVGVVDGDGMGVGDAPPGRALKLPMRKRQPVVLVAGMYSFTCQKVRSSTGSTESEV
jgi:hypothetical protein